MVIHELDVGYISHVRVLANKAITRKLNLRKWSPVMMDALPVDQHL